MGDNNINTILTKEVLQSDKAARKAIKKDVNESTHFFQVLPYIDCPSWFLSNLAIIFFGLFCRFTYRRGPALRHDGQRCLPHGDQLILEVIHTAVFNFAIRIQPLY